MQAVNALAVKFEMPWQVAGNRTWVRHVKSGTFNFWIDPQNHPDAFEPGIRNRWAVFEIEEEKCVICSDGPSLAATLGMGTPKERHLFRVAFSPSMRRRHIVTISWKKGRVRVLLDAQPIADVSLP